MEHSKFVEEMSLNLFDKLKHYHGFSDQERLVFRIASIVHNLETFEISESNYVHIYHFIRGIYIYGLSSKDIENVALIAFYHYTGVKEEHYRFMNDIEDDKKIYIAKMVAIMGIAEALDISYKQKFHKIDITRKKDNIIIDGYTYENAKNEEWNFDKYGEFFEEVYGMKILLNVKRVY
jgi:exopolyphosphatase/guanosine-5'-triphosphate,3'-diphosphate pyrophosphatase